MWYMIFKAGLSGVIIAAVSEIARRAPSLGALVVSLPLVSLMAIMWLWHDTGDKARIAAYTQSTFWYLLPSLPLFLVFPALLRHGAGFWPSLGASCVLTVVLYGAMAWALARFGIRL